MHGVIRNSYGVRNFSKTPEGARFTFMYGLETYLTIFHVCIVNPFRAPC